jgi:hypothetical protein
VARQTFPTTAGRTPIARDTAGARPGILEGACASVLPGFTACGPQACATGCYSFTNAVALMICWKAIGGFFIEHLPPDRAAMARMLSL